MGDTFMNIDYEIIGKQIKTGRKSKNYTQQNFAEYLGVSVSFVSRIERGATKLSLETLVKICSTLDLSLSYLLTGIISTSVDYLKGEIADILRGCSPAKIRLISDIIKAIVEFKE